jgi:hypothetical protein
MNAIDQLPLINSIVARIQACREEIAELKKVLRAAQAMSQADAARQRRQVTEASPEGPRHAR